MTHPGALGFARAGEGSWPHRTILSLAVAILGWWAAVQPVQAVTRVIVQNNTAHGFSVESLQTGHALASQHWAQVTKQVEAGQRAEVLWTNRDTGITDGESFYFATTLETGSFRFQLKQALRGSLVGSHMWQSFSGMGVVHPWSDDRNTHTAILRAGGQSLEVKYRAFFTGTDDNIEYILQQRYETPAAGPNAMNLLAYNIYMRDPAKPPFFQNGQAIRAGLLPG